MSKCFHMSMHVMSHSRTALKRAFEELTYNERVLDVDTFLNLMLKYQPLMRELHKMAQQIKTFFSSSNRYRYLLASALYFSSAAY